LAGILAGIGPGNVRTRQLNTVLGVLMCNIGEVGLNTSHTVCKGLSAILGAVHAVLMLLQQGSQPVPLLCDRLIAEVTPGAGGEDGGTALGGATFARWSGKIRHGCWTTKAEPTR